MAARPEPAGSRGFATAVCHWRKVDVAETTSTAVRREIRETRETDESTEPVQPQSRRRGIVIIVVVLLVLVAAGLWWRSTFSEDTDDAQINGHLIQVSPRIGGQVIRVDVEENQ